MGSRSDKKPISLYKAGLFKGLHYAEAAHYTIVLHNLNVFSNGELLPHCMAGQQTKIS